MGNMQCLHPIIISPIVWGTKFTEAIEYLGDASFTQQYKLGDLYHKQPQQKLYSGLLYIAHKMQKSKLQSIEGNFRVLAIEG